MSAVTQTREDSEPVESEEIVAESVRPSFSGGRVVLGAGVATGAALIAIAVGLPVIGATALGAGIGGGVVAMMAALRAPQRRYR